MNDEAQPELSLEQQVELLTEQLAAAKDEVQLWQNRAIGYMNESSQLTLENKALGRRVARLETAVTLSGPQSTEPTILTPENPNDGPDPQATERATERGARRGAGEREDGADGAS